MLGILMPRELHAHHEEEKVMVTIQLTSDLPVFCVKSAHLQ